MQWVIKQNKVMNVRKGLVGIRSVEWIRERWEGFGVRRAKSIIYMYEIVKTILKVTKLYFN